MCPRNLEREIRVMRKKIDAGADFFLTQPVFEVAKARQFMKDYEAQFGALDIPVMVGVLPLVTDRHARFLHNEVPGIEIPEKIQDRMIRAGDDAAKEGAQIAKELIMEIKDSFQGVYFIPAFNRFDMVAEIIDKIR